MVNVIKSNVTDLGIFNSKCIIKSNVMEQVLLYSHRTRARYETGGAVVFAFEHGGWLRTGLAVLLPLESG